MIGALLTAAAVTAGGLIGFVGLIVPHVGRVLAGRIMTGCCRCPFLAAGSFSSSPISSRGSRSRPRKSRWGS